MPTAGDRLRRDMTISALSRKVERLSAQLELLMSVTDPEELAAAQRLKKISPTNAQLKVWAELSEPPVDLCSEQEERPW